MDWDGLIDHWTIFCLIQYSYWKIELQPVGSFLAAAEARFLFNHLNQDAMHPNMILSAFGGG